MFFFSFCIKHLVKHSVPSICNSFKESQLCKFQSKARAFTHIDSGRGIDNQFTNVFLLYYFCQYRWMVPHGFKVGICVDICVGVGVVCWKFVSDWIAAKLYWSNKYCYSHENSTAKYLVKHYMGGTIKINDML